jgi:hypothetical protein
MSPFAGYLGNLIRDAIGLGFIVGAAGGMVFALLRRNWVLGLLATAAVYAVAAAVDKGPRYLFAFGGYGLPVLLFGYLGLVVPARVLEARAGLRPIVGVLAGLALIGALMFAIRFTSRFGTWAPLLATGFVDVGLAVLLIGPGRAQRLGDRR